MPCPHLPEEGDAGRSPLQPNGTPGCRLQKCSGLPWHPNCCQVTLVWEGSAVLLFPHVCWRAGCDVTQLPCSSQEKQGARVKHRPAGLVLGCPPSPGMSRRSLELFVWVKGSEGPLGISSARSQTQASRSAEASPSTGLATAH